MNEISASGTLTNVQTKFAFISSNRGEVFCPLAASVDPSHFVHSMCEVYRIGDVVNFTAKPQKEKNGCALVATKMRLSKAVATAPKEVSDDDIKTDVLVVITRVQDTLAYGQSTELGDIFIPGSCFCFPSEPTTRITSHLKMGDFVVVAVTHQTEKNGCKWRAVSAVKLYAPTYLQGHGIITVLTPTFATVTSAEWGSVRCSILAWAGGDNGSGQSLLDVVGYGDEVLFEFSSSSENSEMRAARWCLASRGYAFGSAATTDTGSQTLPTAETLFFRSLSPSTLDAVLANRPIVKLLLNEVQSLP